MTSPNDERPEEVYKMQRKAVVRFRKLEMVEVMMELFREELDASIKRAVLHDATRNSIEVIPIAWKPGNEEIGKFALAVSRVAIGCRLLDNHEIDFYRGTNPKIELTEFTTWVEVSYWPE